MNSKKNKHKNKPKPNLNPPQKVESTSTVEKPEETNEEKPESSIKSDERVPEIISEIEPPPVQLKVSEGDTPKKPKRNRGKKKKTDKDDDNDDNQEHKAPEPVIEEVKVAEEVKVIEESKYNRVELDKIIEIQNITPTARKKKNKNKKNTEHPSEEDKLLEKELISIPKQEDVKSELGYVETDIKQETISPKTPEFSEQDTKTSKKKNKKKNRSDSERSERTDDAIACTSAFQQLLEPKDENTELKEDKKSEVHPSTEATSISEVPLKFVIDLNKECIESITENIEAISHTELKSPELPKDEGGKGKKKNKKDKKPPPKTNLEEQEQKRLETETITEDKPVLITTVIDLIPEDILKDKVTKEHIEFLNLKTPAPVNKEESPKPKAKIAKPVEKKHVEKSDAQITENISGPECVPTEEKTSGLEMKTEILILKEPIEERKSDIPDTIKLEHAFEKQEEITNVIQQIENIKVPQSGMGKKRKKSPKPPKRDILVEVTKPESELIKSSDEDFKERIEARIELLSTPIPLEDNPPKDTQNITIAIQNEALETIKSSNTSDEMIKYKSTDAIPIPVTIETPIEDIVEQVNVTETSDIMNLPGISEQSLEAQKFDQITVLETGKKKKKSPKLPKKLESTPRAKVFTAVELTDSNITNTGKVVKLERKEESESPPDLPPLEDIEIRSIKADDSEGSVSDILPDIHYPRASSQLLDNNNNLMIQDVSTDDDMKLNIPFVIPDTPFIQGSGETPIIIPEIMPTGIRITEIDTIRKPNDEKTDLKSKVMEVNKDMEDLRKSIEKSLAEFTAMEKTEKEKHFEQSQIKLEVLKPVELKPDATETKDKIVNSSEILSKSQLETAPIEVKDVKPVTEKPESTGTPDVPDVPVPPVCPSRKDNKGKNKSKKKGKQEAEQRAVFSTTTASSNTDSGIAGSSTTKSTSTGETKESSKGTKDEEKSEQKSEKSQEKGKQQSISVEECNNTGTRQQDTGTKTQAEYNPIENFDDAMTSSLDDVNQSFEMIANEADRALESDQGNTQINPEISITAPTEEDEKVDKQEKINPVSQPKNLIGHPDIPARLNKTDYKKEKNKTQQLAKVKIKDAVPVEVNEQCKDQPANKQKLLRDQKSIIETKEKDEYVYKYSFRKVFLPSACHVCKKELKQTRVPCSYCNLLFYCSPKHKDEDYAQHQAFCFAVSTIVHLKDQKFIYADAKDVVGHNYRLLRMQMIVSCEKVLKRKLAPFEQEALLYPRICADVACREWRQAKLRDCEGCGQISYCSDHPDHFPKSHQRWCNSYCLYHKLVGYQQSSGRLVPKLPSRVMAQLCQIPEKLNEVLASMYEEKIDIDDTQYAALTQVATAPLTAAYSQQLYCNKMNSTYANGFHKNSSFTIHMVGAELQFEADAMNKWEVFFLHLRPDVRQLRVVLIGPDINSSNLPLDLLGKIKLCDNCHQNKRRVVFDFQDKKTYQEYWSTEFVTPDLVCAFNPSIYRASSYNGKDMWPSTIRCILKLKVPFVVTSYSMTELLRDMARIKECAEMEFNVISEPKLNSFASVRPDRNFISDDEIPLLFKNYCFSVVCGAF